nr:immunoglobulin light chain junction region [Macaca mulatta]MOW39329.1 immunoglobulin light chain junction region [Macaca mulatta]MOW39354.1 immunoglobulin light chain junction region [Macaca mulatta]MOW39432.1 immunoglobulin light chain junction region [Macaca mulatta]MOW39610.1 immunoglobulin light chain junction region [Macaca mulatta]
CGQGTNVPWTF